MKDRINKLASAGMLLGVVLLLGGCGMVGTEKEIRPDLIKEQNKVDKERSYQLADVMRGDVTFDTTIMCKAYCDKEESMKFGVSGIEYGMTYVDVGDKVKKGDLLAELSMEGIEEELNAAKQEYELARLEYSNYDTQIADARRIGELNNMSKAEIEEQVRGITDNKISCAATLRLAQTRYNEAISEKKKRQIYAPMDGVITFLFDPVEVEKSQGEDAPPVVSNMDTEFVRMSSGNYHFRADTEDYSNYKEGDVVDVDVNGQTYKMKITKDEKMENSDKDMHRLTFDLLEAGSRIEEQTVGWVKAPVTTQRNVLYVENDAIVSIDGKQYVYLLNEDNVRSIQEITMGLSNDTYTVIKSGVSEGQKVILK